MDDRLRASPVGRRKPATQTVRPGPFALDPGQKMGHGPARLARARSGATHPAMHPIRAGCFGQFQQTGQRLPV
jgi:hypothetical protein